MFARVERADLTAVKERQGEHGMDITKGIAASLARRVMTASDWDYEDGRCSAGFLCVSDPGKPEESRLGKEILVPETVYSLCLCGNDAKRTSHSWNF